MALSRITNPFLSSSGSGNASITSPSANTIAFSTSTSERMRIDSSGNVGIGTSSPTYKFTLNKGSAGVLGEFTDNVNTNFRIETSGFLCTVGPTAGSTSMAFRTNNTEVMRIDTNNNLYVGYANSGGVWGERILAWTGVNAGTASSAVGIGSYNPSNSYTGSLFRAQSETGATTGWKLYEGRYAGGGISYYITGDGGGYFGGYTGFQTTNPIRTVTINGELSLTTSGTSYFNVSDTAGSNGNARALVIRGLGTSGSVQNTLTSVTLDASALYFTGAGGASNAYVCRAWVNFNGTGTIAIRASGNVSSITDGGVGIYRVNFSTSMPDVNFSTNASTAGAGTVNTSTCCFLVNATSATTQTSNVAYVDVWCFHPGNQVAQDNAWCSVSVFR